MNWKQAIQTGCADRTEQEQAWAEIERLRASLKRNEYECGQLEDAVEKLRAELQAEKNKPSVTQLAREFSQQTHAPGSE